MMLRVSSSVVTYYLWWSCYLPTLPNVADRPFVGGKGEALLVTVFPTERGPMVNDKFPFQRTHNVHWHFVDGVNLSCLLGITTPGLM